MYRKIVHKNEGVKFSMRKIVEKMRKIKNGAFFPKLVG